MRVHDAGSGAAVDLYARLTIIAAGPWSGQLARRAGAVLTMSLARGSMLAYEGLLVRGVVNRLQPPGDGDILLPRGTVSIAGTTAVPTEDPDDRIVSPSEIERITEEISAIVPGIRGRPVKTFLGRRAAAVRHESAPAPGPAHMEQGLLGPRSRGHGRY